MGYTRDIHDTGRRNRRIEFKRAGGTVDDMGEVDRSSITTVAGRWAYVKTLSGVQDRMSDGIVYEGDRILFITNYTASLMDQGLYITYRSKDYDIKHIDNVDGGDETTIYTTQVRTGGGYL